MVWVWYYTWVLSLSSFLKSIPCLSSYVLNFGFGKFKEFGIFLVIDGEKMCQVLNLIINSCFNSIFLNPYMNGTS